MRPIGVEALVIALTLVDLTGISAVHGFE